MAGVIWRALGQPKHYIEPFFGSGAVLLARPNYDPTVHVETICDVDGYVCCVWRALQSAPDEVARWCDWPVNHACLSARRRRLLANEARLLENLVADDEWYDARLAGYWIWAASCWIGAGLTRLGSRPAVSKGGEGVHKLSLRPGADESDDTLDPRAPYNTNLYTWFRALSERLRYVRVVCGDWTRVCGGDWQDNMPPVGIFFDPPYCSPDRDPGIYHAESLTVARDVEAWALARGDRPTYRIVIAGYEGDNPGMEAAGWHRYDWSAGGGYARLHGGDTQGMVNRHSERLWFSPQCLRNEGPQQLGMFGESEEGDDDDT